MMKSIGKLGGAWNRKVQGLLLAVLTGHAVLAFAEEKTSASDETAPSLPGLLFNRVPYKPLSQQDLKRKVPASSQVREEINELIQKRQWKEAEQLCLEKIELFKRIGGAFDNNALVCQVYLAMIYASQGQIDQAVQVHRGLVDGLKMGVSPGDPRRHQFQSTFAKFLKEKGRLVEAETEERLVLDICLRHLEKDHHETLLSRSRLAEILMLLGKADEAEEQQRWVVETLQRLIGKNERATLAARSSWACMLNAQGKYAEAKTELISVLEIQQKLVGPEDKNTLATRSNLAAAYDGLKDYDRAEAEHRAVLGIRERVFGKEDAITLKSRTALGRVLVINPKKISEAEKIFREVLKVNESKLSPDHPTVCAANYDVAVALFLQKKWKEARDYAQKSLEGYHKRLPPGSRRLQTVEDLMEEIQGALNKKGR